MSRDTPDWGGSNAQGAIYPVQDLGELAARLGSIVTFDRRGDVVWMDDFEDSINKWDINLSGTDAAVAISTAAMRNGASSALLTAGSSESRYAEISRGVHALRSSRLGFEASFALADAPESLTLEMWVYSGTQLVKYSIRWREGNDDLQYRGSAGAFVTFATGLPLTPVLTTWNTMKMVIDPTAKKYVRAMLNDTEYSLSAVAADDSLTTVDPSIYVIVTNVGDSGSLDKVYVDDAIVTQNEPAN